MTTEIILALDFPSIDHVRALTHQLDPARCRLKIGKELFTGYGPSLVVELQDQGFQIFLDLKFHDIPNTVAAACAQAARLGVWMVNVHALGGPEMISKSRDAIEQHGNKTLLTAVTVLTSHDQAAIAAVGLHGDIAANVQRLAILAETSGAHGIVCSAQEVALLKSCLASSCLFVTPGIRPQWAANNDQARIMTPADAQALGIQHIVVGRPVTQAQDPLAALAQIEAELSHSSEIITGD